MHAKPKDPFMSRLPILFTCIWLAACAPAQESAFNAADEARRAAETAKSGSATPEAEQDARVWTRGAMVAAADPRAVEAGLDMLNQGGTAIDAAIAVHAVLGLVEPQSSGIGGGAFMVYYNHERDEITVFDGRETAPSTIRPDYFIRNGKVMGFVEAWQSGKSVGVPGQVALYKTAHDAAGNLNWDTLFQPAITLAEEGFEVSPRLAGLLADERLRGVSRIDDLATPAAYFYPEGAPLAAGTVRTNPDYAATLQVVATEGPAAFYEGDIAKAIVKAISSEQIPGEMSAEDLSGYTVKIRPALCGEALNDYRICSAPPPSSGGVTQNMIMGLYQRLAPDPDASATEADFLKAFVDAQRLAYADRDHYVADADMVTVPALDLIDPGYLKVRATEAFAPDEPVSPGDPGVALGRDPLRPLWGEDATEPAPGTTHISIVDSQGNAVSMTASIEAPFGSSIMVGGFLLNNELTDFALNPVKGTKPLANAPGPGKRPRSSMSPTIIFDPDGNLFMLTGSPGGNSIVAYVAKTIIGVLEWGKTAQEAINLPNVIARGDTVAVEIDMPGGAEAAEELRQLGYNVQERTGENSGLYVIVVREDGLEGGADPRREGIAKALD